ncbi:hypothetical protein [Massilia sp. TN1-12]|uniref:hypothetical protein n=1 Tax=Massilia paldalensis TaxID=3377675 RepID=UPI00384F283F
MNSSSTTAFWSWCAAAPVTALGIMTWLTNVGGNAGYLLPLIALCAIAALFIAALLTGLLTKTTITSLSGLLVGLVLTICGISAML